MIPTDNASRTSKEQRIEDCKRLFIKYNGREHERIEFEMRALGHTNFHRRALYDRFKNGKCHPGWISRFGWEDLLTAGTQSGGERFKQDAQDKQDSKRDRKIRVSNNPVHPVYPVKLSSLRLGNSAVKKTDKPDSFHA